MDIQALKIKLVNQIINSTNASLLIKIGKMFPDEEADDWWDQLPIEVQDSILEGMKEVEEGDVYSHENVIREAKQRYGF